MKRTYMRKGAVITDITLEADRTKGDEIFPLEPIQHLKSVNAAKKRSRELQAGGARMVVVDYLTRHRVVNKAQSKKTSTTFLPKDETRAVARKAKKAIGSVLNWELGQGKTLSLSK